MQFNLRVFVFSIKPDDIDSVSSISDIEDNFDILNDHCSCTVFTNECMNNINVCYNLYEKSSDIFHSLVSCNVSFSVYSINCIKLIFDNIPFLS